MCLYKLRKGSQPVLAKRPIIVYKLLLLDNIDDFLKLKHPRFISPFRKEEYYSFEIKTAPFNERNFNPKLLPHLHSSAMNIVEDGLHSFTTIKAAKNGRRNIAFYINVYLARMVIPVGAYYVKGEDGEIVSDTLITGDLLKVQRL